MVLPSAGVLDDTELEKRIRFFEQFAGVKPYDAQCDLLRQRSRYKILLCGRRWGKTLYLAMELLWYIHWLHEMNHPRPRVRLVAPEHPQIREVMNYFTEFCAKANLPLREIKDPKDPHFLAGRVRLEPRSAKNRTSHRGPGLSLVVLDEVSDIDPDLYYYSIAPSLSDYQGHVIMAGTPKGLNWVVQFAEKQGIELPYTNLSGFTMLVSPDQRAALMRSPTWANPHIDPAEIEFQRQILPAEVFAQEYGAEILIGYLNPFVVQPEYVGAFTDEDYAAMQHAVWAVGVDYGYKSQSAAVLAALCTDGIVRIPYVGYETHIDEFSFAQWVGQALEYKVGKGEVLAVIGDADFSSERGRRSIADNLRDLGYPFLTGIRDRVGRWARLRECLNNMRVRVLEPSCTGLVQEFKTAKPHNYRMGDIEKPDHALTALAYALDFLAKRRAPTVPFPPVENHLQEEILRFYQRNVLPMDEFQKRSNRQGHRVSYLRSAVLDKRRWT